jgi:hypothetical protein
LEVQPNHAVARYIQACVLFHLQNTETAIQVLVENTSTLNPTHMASHELLAHIYMSAEAHDMARVIEVFDNALKHADIHEQTQVIASKALYLLCMKKYEESVSVCEAQIQKVLGQTAILSTAVQREELDALNGINSFCKEVSKLVSRYTELQQEGPVLWPADMLKKITVAEEELFALVDCFSALSLPLTEQQYMLSLSIHFKRILQARENGTLRHLCRNAFICAALLGDMYATKEQAQIAQRPFRSLLRKKYNNWESAIEFIQSNPSIKLDFIEPTSIV